MPKEAFAWLARYNRANRFAYQRLADGRSRTYDDTRNRRSEGTDRRSQGNGDERQKQRVLSRCGTFFFLHKLTNDVQHGIHLSLVLSYWVQSFETCRKLLIRRLSSRLKSDIGNSLTSFT